MAANPEVFWLFLILIPVVILILFQYLNGRKSIMKTSGSWRSQQFYDLYTVKWFFSSLGFVIFIVFAILSLAGYPGKGYPVSYEPSGTDIIFVVDISKSMKAGDVSPSRLGMSERIIRSVCENTPSGRFGLVVFKGRGIKVIPSTEDVEAVYNFLEYMSPDLISSPGSNIESGLEAAVGAFPSGEERKKYIVLLSDGEALSGELDQILMEAVAKDIEIYCAGIGTSEGSSIPDSDGGLVTDAAGDTVISRLDEQSLMKIAETTSGKYYNALDNQLLPDLIALAGGTVMEGSDAGFRIVTKERYRFFLIFAILGLLIAKSVKVIKWKDLY